MKKREANLTLKASIIEKGLKLEDVANAINMPVTSFSRKINGHQVFDEIEIEKICNFLNKNPLDIFFRNHVTKQITKSA